MGTSADIIIQTDEGYESVTLAYDGYPSSALKILNEHYKDRDKVIGLIDCGDTSKLDESIECPKGHTFDNRIPGYSVFYDRDRNERGMGKMFHDRLDWHKSASYSYLFTLNNEWEDVANTTVEE